MGDVESGGSGALSGVTAVKAEPGLQEEAGGGGGRGREAKLASLITILAEKSI